MLDDKRTREKHEDSRTISLGYSDKNFRNEGSEETLRIKGARLVIKRIS